MGKAEQVSADYVVVGAGSAGCAVAGRLAESGASVILLEAGGRDKSFLVRKPGMIGPMHAVPQLKAKFDWGYYSVPQEHILGRKMPGVRGKVMGGSSAINGMLFVRGNKQNYDDWAAEGCAGWGYDDVLPSFKKLETWEDGGSDLRGSGGPIHVVRRPDVTEASLEFQEAASSTLGVPIVEDYNAGSQEGMSIFQESAKGGLRYSTSQGYVTELHPPSLHVRTGGTVSRIVIEGGRATGVEVLGRKGARQLIHAGKEVVVSAGVFGSAQILMLSGVGPADHLVPLGIGVNADLPVGDNLHDHLFVPSTWLMPNAVHRGTAGYFGKGLVKELTRGGTFLAHTVFETAGFVRTSQATNVPDLQIHVLPWAYPSPNQDAPVRHTVDNRAALTVMATLIYPKSRGNVRLASSDPTAAPLIDPNYLADESDRRLLVEGMAMVREIMGNPAIKGSVTGELHPGDAWTDATADHEVRNRATTVYHPVGTCRMGVDERAVVDPQLRVRGIEGLRVADASVMPSITGGNTNAPAIMIGEHCAAIVLKGTQR